jgi:SAM-dependent methyltransferase
VGNNFYVELGQTWGLLRVPGERWPHWLSERIYRLDTEQGTQTHERVQICDLHHDGAAHVEDVERYRFAGRFVRARRVLDIACGSGYGARLLAEYGAQQTVGADISWDAVAAASRFATDTILLITADARVLPFFSDSFDAVVSLETLEHVSDASEFLGEIRRVLKSDGLAIISTPLNDGPGRFAPTNRFHNREYNRREFVALLSEHFCKVELWDQLSEYGDDLLPRALDRSLLVTRARGLAARVVPHPLRAHLRHALGSAGRRPYVSTITRAAQTGREIASAQLAVCA